MLSHGYALAGSSYATTGWAIAQALPDQISTLNTFGSLYGQPQTTVAWGHSLGGIITAGLIQDYPKRFDAALPMCGVLSGGVATWNTALDGAFAFQQLIDPSLQVVNITNPTANLQAAEAAVAQAQQTPQGRARLALVAALADTPGWFTPLSPEPAATDYAAQEANQFLWDTQVTFPFIFAFRAELEARAGGNPSWNTGVNYFTDLAQVRRPQGGPGALPGRRAQPGPRPADAEQREADQGQPERRGLPDQEHLLQRRHLGPGAHHAHHRGRPGRPGERAGVPQRRQPGPQGDLLRQVFVNRAGHCAFTPAETVTAVQTLENRMSTGQWNVPEPGRHEQAAAALGAGLNIFSSGGKIVPTAPAFISYSPARYLRPFNLFPQFSSRRYRLPSNNPTERPGWPAPVLAARHPASASPIGGGRGTLDERPDLLGDAPPVRGRGQLAEEREQAQVDPLQDDVGPGNLHVGGQRAAEIEEAPGHGRGVARRSWSAGPARGPCRRTPPCGRRSCRWAAGASGIRNPASSMARRKRLRVVRRRTGA